MSWAIAVWLAVQAGAPQERWPDSRPIARVVPNLWRDLRSLPSATSAWIAAAGAGGSLAGHPSDARVAAWAGRSAAPRYTMAGDFMGRRAIHLGAAFLLYGTGKIAGHKASAHMGGDLLRAQIVSVLLTGAIKYPVDRLRPDGGRLSFPSGHTSAAFTSAAVLHAHFGWKAAIPAYAAAAFVAWTRVHDRRHWLSDVMTGAAVGIIAGRAATHHTRDTARRRWALTPAIIPGGVAVVIAQISREPARRP